MFFSESETVELKSVYTDELKKEIIAFANTEGGKIYIGVEDDGTVCGVENPDFVIQQITNAERDAVKPDVTMFMHIRTLQENGVFVVEVEVQCGSHKPYYLARKGLRPEGVYVRQGTSCVPASDMAIRRMIKETDGDNYEDMRSLNQSLTFEKAEAEFACRGLPFGDTQKQSLGLTDADGIYSNLALLLSDQCPHIIKSAMFSGPDGEYFHDRQEFTGSLLQQLEDAYAYLEFRNETGATFEGLLRVDHRAYPDAALREALLNAVVHRDYAVSAGTLVKMYDDCVEIISAGGLAAGISYDDMMLGISCCRNRKLAEIFYRLKLIEAYGTGMAKIMNSYKYACCKPLVQVSSGAFKITLPNLNRPEIVAESAALYGSGQSGSGRTGTVTGRGAAGRKHFVQDNSLSDREQAVLQLLQSRGKLTRAEVEEALGVSISTARRILLKLAENGLIDCRGQGKNSVYVIHE